MVGHSAMKILLLWLNTRLVLIKESRKKKHGNICQVARHQCSQRRSNDGNLARNHRCNPALGKCLKSDSNTRWSAKTISKTKKISEEETSYKYLKEEVEVLQNTTDDEKHY